MRRALLGAVIITLVAAGGAFAATATTNLTVNATVAANCTIATTAVGFGAYDPVAGATINTSGTVTIACTKGSAPTIGMGLGANAQGSTRRMTNSTDFLTYELYQPPNNTPGTACSFPGTVIWGTTGANLFTPTVPGSKNPRTYNVCGTLLSGQDVGVGSYADTVVATVTF